MISVIVPVYNTEKYLPKCLDSILNQTYDNLEILIIDDGSTDGSSQICNDYLGKDERVKVWHRENKGVSASRNFALTKSRGKWVSFVDSDDWLSKDMLQTMLNLAEKYKADTVCCDHYYCDEDQCNIERTWKYFDSDEFIREKDAIFSDILCRTPFLWDKLLNGKEAREIGFDENIGYGEDLLFLAEYFSKMNKVVGTKAPLYYYRKYREGSITSTNINEKYLDYLKVAEEVADIFHDHNADYAAIVRIVPVIVKTLSRIPVFGMRAYYKYLDKAKQLSEKVKPLEYSLKHKKSVANFTRKIMLLATRKSRILAVMLAKIIYRVEEK